MCPTYYASFIEIFVVRKTEAEQMSKGRKLMTDNSLASFKQKRKG